MLNFVSQSPYPKACQHACWAMIAGVSLEEVIAVAPSMPMSWDDREKVAAHFGFVIPGNRAHIAIEVFGNETPHCLMRQYDTIIFGLYAVDDPCYAHAVLYHKGNMYDPQIGINPSWPWYRRMSVACPVVPKK